MENHFHLIAQGNDLSEKMRHFKSYTAKEIIAVFKQKRRTRLLKHLQHSKLRHKTDSIHQVWQEGFHPQQMIGDDIMIQKIEYIFVKTL
jgi:REP element-mobilizing transposase RayT